MGEKGLEPETMGEASRRAAEDLLPSVYKELRGLAAFLIDREAPGQTLQPTALVHEAYLRLVREEGAARWDNTAHFFSAAAQSMRRILIERARRRLGKKHGGEHTRQRLDLDEIALPVCSEELLALDEALGRLGALNPRLAQLVELRFFAGLTIKEAARALGISNRTADSDWSYARAWLLAELSEGGG